MKKKLCIILILFLCLAAVFLISKRKLHPPVENDFLLLAESIQNSACAKFECNNSAQKENPLFITSEIRTISMTFSSLDLVESDIEISEWNYRITFNCSELFLGSKEQEIVVEVGGSALSINGKSYTTPEGVPFSKVLELIASKYTYFKN